MTAIGEESNRTAFATLALKSELRAALFALLDHKPEDRIHELVWKMLEP